MCEWLANKMAGPRCQCKKKKDSKRTYKKEKDHGTDISFENEIQCIQFAQQNYTPINIHVNNFYKTEGVLYDFACVSNEEYKVLLDTSTEN